MLFLVVAPGVVAGLMPWLITSWRSTDPALAVKALGGVLPLAGAGAVLHAVARSVIEGAGTPAPVAPTERLVVGGRYRHVRNPMYVAVGADRRAGRCCSAAHRCSPTRRSSTRS